MFAKSIAFQVPVGDLTQIRYRSSQQMALKGDYSTILQSYAISSTVRLIGEVPQFINEILSALIISMCTLM